VSALSLDEAKAHLNITADVDDSELQAFIDAAERAIAHYTGPLEPTTRTIRVPGGQALVLPVPVISLTTVTPILPGATALDLSGFDIDPISGVVTNYTALPLSAREYIVTYVAGWSDVPDDLLLAVKVLLRHFWSSQRGGGQRPGRTPEPAAVPYALPYFVLTLIEPYQRPGIA